MAESDASHDAREQQNKQRRRIIQIAVSTTSTRTNVERTMCPCAVCNDGSTWWFDGQWRRIPNIPQD